MCREKREPFATTTTKKLDQGKFNAYSLKDGHLYVTKSQRQISMFYQLDSMHLRYVLD